MNYWYSLSAVMFLGCMVTSSPSYPALDNLNPTASPDIQKMTVQGLIKRLVGNRSDEFQVEIDPHYGPLNRANYKLESDDNNIIKITGNTGVAAALGFHNYLKYWAECHVSWSGNQINLPTILPRIKRPIKMSTNDQFRYYQNVCTTSYSFVWWKWKRWEQEIDWMALNGINLPLAFSGQEAIWMRVYKQLGFAKEDLDDFFTGPAFLAWNRMGNVDGWGGPLSVNWTQKQLQLQHQILDRMRGFGMIPVLPAFSGHVPRSIQKLFPEANVSQLEAWGKFNETYCCTYLLNPEDPLFLKIGSMFIHEMTKEFNGTDHIYNCDTFNEMTPSSGDLNYLKAIGQSIFKAMTSVDKKAVWLMQGWLFNDAFWTSSRAKALLRSVPLGKMIILDLQADLYPKYNVFDSFFGQPFIWCMLHNFGGVLGLYGAVQNVSTGPFIGRHFDHSTMVGTGITPEGINQNDVMYDFMNEMAWRKEPVSIRDWFLRYSNRRYGGRNGAIDQAWQKLTHFVYNCTDGHKQHGGYIIVKRPKLNMTPLIWYPPKIIFDVWYNMLIGSPQFDRVGTFLYDTVDITRESLQTLGNQFYSQIVQGYNNKNKTLLKIAGDKMQELLTDMDTILATDSHFLLGCWLEEAKANGESKSEQNSLEYNARNQVTLWGPTGNILDYAGKQWSGMFSHYYAKRWKLFVNMLEEALSTKQKFNLTEFNERVFVEVEQPFTFDNSPFPTVPSGDTILVSHQLYKKWSPQINYRLLNKSLKKYQRSLVKNKLPNQKNHLSHDTV